jgi:crossover junction endodeoxyribonuclease RuvC
VRIFGIDPGSERTGYGCVETDGRVARLVLCGAIAATPGDAFPQRLARIHHELGRLLNGCEPDCVAIEALFHAANVRTALKLGHARGVAVLAAVQAGCPVVEYTPAEIKRAVVGYGRAEKLQVQQMIKLLLGLAQPPSPHDAADALAVAICHLHSLPPPFRAGLLGPDKRVAPRGVNAEARLKAGSGLRADRAKPRTWRQYRPPSAG